MKHEKEDLIAYRMERALETLEEARLMSETGHWRTCINRLYYACFYGVSALLLEKDMSFSKHTGVKAAFNREFILTGIIPKECGRLYNLLFKYRQQSDYEDFFSVDQGIVREWMVQSKRFVERISQVLDKK